MPPAAACFPALRPNIYLARLKSDKDGGPSASTPRPKFSTRPAVFRAKYGYDVDGGFSSSAPAAARQTMKPESLSVYACGAVAAQAAQHLARTQARRSAAVTFSERWGSTNEPKALDLSMGTHGNTDQLPTCRVGLANRVPPWPMLASADSPWLHISCSRVGEAMTDFRSSWWRKCPVLGNGMPFYLGPSAPAGVSPK